MIDFLAQSFVKSYHGQTTIHPAALVALSFSLLLLLSVPRKYALLPFILIACFIAPAQRIVIATIDLNLIRILVIVGWIRVFARRENTEFRWSTLDFLLLAYAVTSTFTYTLQTGSVEGFIYRAGSSFDIIGMYFLFRMLVRNLSDLRQALLWFVIAALPVTVAFVIENRTRQNLFGFLGGVPLVTNERDGRLRCQGAFAHPILAGCFWASLLPMIAATWWRGLAGKRLAVTGVLCGALIVALCASSTPILAVLAGVAGMGFYRFRYSMRSIRWVLTFSLVVLHFVMEAPVWHLVSRVSAVGGSTGWYRYKLIDSYIRNFDEWYLVGTSSVLHWGVNMSKGDVPNQYVYEGVRGGIASLGLFIAVIIVAYVRVGVLWRAMATQSDRILAWAIGVSLFVHCVSFIGATYFGQITVLWALALALTSISPAAVDNHEGATQARYRAGRVQQPRKGSVFR